MKAERQNICLQFHHLHAHTQITSSIVRWSHCMMQFAECVIIDYISLITKLKKKYHLTKLILLNKISNLMIFFELIQFIISH